VRAVLEAWCEKGILDRAALSTELPGTPARVDPLPPSLPAPVAAALRARGIDGLYRHQSEAYARAMRGEHLVIATPTASGKSLCYNLPVLDRLVADPGACALYLFPTKALGRDQEEALRSLLRDAGLAEGAITYDGDTPGDARRAARERASVLLTNPDMLHAGILPHHAGWARLFARLRFVVVDELHTYRGVFGSHLANVLRRLRRIARFHGSDPTFVFASATIGNPAEHASRMLGEEARAITESGAPQGPRTVVVYNPPVVNAELGIRASYLKTAVRLTADLVRAEVPTLVFGQSRNGVEVMLKYLRDRLSKEALPPEAIKAYRGGYLPETRRGIEAGLRSGEIRCVVSTNALELGIDVGTLEAVVCAGYPGTVAGLWQRFGRAGRRKGPSLSVLVPSSMPVDQYVAQQPEHLLSAKAEQARIDPDNVEILVQHLKCAAFELPFDEGDGFGDVPPSAVQDALGFLADHRVIHRVPQGSGGARFHWATDAYPANHVSLRNLGWDNFVVVDLEAGRTIAEMDFRSTHTMLHEQAIYQHDGEPYQVERLDYENHKAFVRHVEPDYYTTARTHTRVSVLEVDERASLFEGRRFELAAGLGEVSVVEKVVGYKKIKFHTHENVGYGDVHLPEMQMHTSAFWLTFPEAFVASRPEPRPTVIDALRGLSKAMHLIASMGLMIDPRDLGRTLGDRHDPEGPPGKDAPRGGGEPGFDPTVFLYDQVAGGVGLAPRLFDERESLLRRTLALVSACACADGCPACIGPGAGLPEPPVVGLPPLRKARVRALLEDLGVTVLH
jgi:DEAD/DEAH box helicase domain-containing protein